MQTAYLLTGMPGSGKTTLIRQVVSGLGSKAGGFFTEEIRVGGIRQGFRVVTLTGQTATLASTEIQGRYHVSKYGVDLQALEKVAIPALETSYRECEVVVVDEIGKMELFSEKFKSIVLEIISSGKPVLGTILLKPEPWADELKRKKQVRILKVTRNNHSEILEEIEKWLGMKSSEGKS